MERKETGIGILGCGAIGRGLAAAIRDELSPGLRVVALFDQDSQRAEELAGSLNMDVKATSSFETFIGIEAVDMVVEAASGDAVRSYAESILNAGKDLMVMSTGGLLDSRLFANLDVICRRVGVKILIPSGAVGGIDAIRASRAFLQEVVLTTRKPPETLVDVESEAGRNLESIDSPKIVFEGNALEAVKRFPFNINVAATLSLAGLGPEKTKVRIVADPQAKGNIHEVYAKGQSGILRFTMENVPHPDNPKTSHLALLSAIEVLRNVGSGWGRIGS